MGIERCPLDLATQRVPVALGVVKMETNEEWDKNENWKENFTCLCGAFVVSLNI